MEKKLVQYFIIPAFLIAGCFAFHALPYTKYQRVCYAALSFVLIADIAVIVRGRLRDIALVSLSLLLGLTGIETMAIRLEESALSREPSDFIDSDSLLGWAPARAGTFRAQSIGEGGVVNYDVDYTIDSDFLRHTESAPIGPIVAFFGDSMTFGQGVGDGETLPQAFADLSDRNLRVFNFGFPGYGPQQFLRAVETGRFDGLLRPDLKLIVYQTSPWHATRSSCKEGFVLEAPKYELIGGDPVFAGACAEGLTRLFREVVTNSATYRVFFRYVYEAASAADIELYLAEILKAARLAGQKYGVTTAVLFMPAGRHYLKSSGYTDEAIVNRLRAGGLRVIDGRLNPKDFPPGTALTIPGDGHPSAIAHRARAEILVRALAADGGSSLSKLSEARSRILDLNFDHQRLDGPIAAP